MSRESACSNKEVRLPVMMVLDRIWFMVASCQKRRWAEEDRQPVQLMVLEELPRSITGERCSHTKSPFNCFAVSLHLPTRFHLIVLADSAIFHSCINISSRLHKQPRLPFTTSIIIPTTTLVTPYRITSQNVTYQRIRLTTSYPRL